MLRLHGSLFPPCTQDLSGRPHLSCGLDIPTQRVGTYDTQVIVRSANFLSFISHLFKENILDCHRFLCLKRNNFWWNLQTKFDSHFIHRQCHAILFVLYTPAVKLGKSFIYSLWFQLVEHFFQSLVNTSGMTLHIRQVHIAICSLLKSNSLQNSWISGTISVVSNQAHHRLSIRVEIVDFTLLLDLLGMTLTLLLYCLIPLHFFFEACWEKLTPYYRGMFQSIC